MQRVAFAVLMLMACSKAKEPEPRPAPAKAEHGDPFLTFDTSAPVVGAVAPPVELTSLTGEHVSLAKIDVPTVLVFASFTCPPSRMKLPGFEALQQRWAGKAKVYVVYSREAHPHAKSSERLNGFADQVQARDKDHDGNVTVAEYGDLGPRYMFDAFDLDHDGTVRSYELLAARRLQQFKDVDAPKTLDERIALAHKLREQVPGSVPILVDGLDDAVTNSYGGLPNMAYVIAPGGKVAFKIPWAAVADIEQALAKLTGAAVTPAEKRAPDLAVVKPQLAAAAAAHRPLLIELSAIGCAACETMAKTLEAPELQASLGRYEIAKLGIDHDAEWGLFEALQLSATPSFVVMKHDGTAVATLQGSRDAAAVKAFLDAHVAN